MTTQNQTASKVYAKETAAAEAILKGIASGLVSITAETKKLAAIAVSIRGSIERSVTSKKTAKAVKVPDWTGYSPEYREWYRDTLVPLIDKIIPEDFRGTIKSRLQNQVQELAHKTATPAQKQHLGMKAQSKATTQAEKRQTAQNASNASPARDSEEAFSPDDLVKFTKTAKVEEVCQHLAAMSEALAARVRANGFEVSKAEAGRSEKLVGQALSHLMTGRATLSSIAHPSGVRVEETAAA